METLKLSRSVKLKVKNIFALLFKSTKNNVHLQLRNYIYWRGSSLNLYLDQTLGIYSTWVNLLGGRFRQRGYHFIYGGTNYFEHKFLKEICRNLTYTYYYCNISKKVNSKKKSIEIKILRKKNNYEQIQSLEWIELSLYRNGNFTIQTNIDSFVTEHIMIDPVGFFKKTLWGSVF